MSEAQRRMVGLLIGLVLGLPYSIISEYINVWLLPGIPLAEPAVGRFTTVVLTILALCIIGLLVAWDKDSFRGIVAGALFTVVMSSYLAFINSGSPQPEKTILLFIFTFLPRTVLYIPITLFIHWVLSRIERAAAQPAGSIGNIALAVIAALIVAVAGGCFSLLPSEARQALRDANKLTFDGVSSVVQKTGLPEPLMPVEGFSAYASGPYTLRWSDAVDSLNVVRPVTAEPVIESLIIVHFENGYTFGCVYTPPGHVPKCINITQVQ